MELGLMAARYLDANYSSPYSSVTPDDLHKSLSCSRNPANAVDKRLNLNQRGCARRPLEIPRSSQGAQQSSACFDVSDGGDGRGGGRRPRSRWMSRTIIDKTVSSTHP